ncbi:MAG: histidinol-phosphate transaminase [Steroidobacteraceae bacterium]
MSGISALIQTLARPEILALEPYSHADWQPHLVRLHANEAPWRPAGDTTAAGLNLYPEPIAHELGRRLAALYEMDPRQLLVTRGSDEAIDLLSRIFLRAGHDAVLQTPPTFGMYKVAARIQGAQVIDAPLLREQDWRLDPARLLAAWVPEARLVYLCSPNNPTGNRLDDAALLQVCEALAGKAIVAMDEAYIEWSGAASFTRFLARHPHLVILRTLSKAHALAGARCGALIAHPDIISLAARVIPPYAISQGTIESVLRALEPAALTVSRERLASLLGERRRLAEGLAALPEVEKVWPSDANFLMIDCHDPALLLRRAAAGGFILRDLTRQASLARSLRVSVGSPEHNRSLLRSLATP